MTPSVPAVMPLWLRLAVSRSSLAITDTESARPPSEDEPEEEETVECGDSDPAASTSLWPRSDRNESNRPRSPVVVVAMVELLLLALVDNE